MHKRLVCWVNHSEWMRGHTLSGQEHWPRNERVFIVSISLMCSLLLTSCFDSSIWNEEVVEDNPWVSSDASMLCFCKKKERKKSKPWHSVKEQSGTKLVGGRYSRKILADYDKGQRNYFSSVTSVQAEGDYSQGCSGWAVYVRSKAGWADYKDQPNLRAWKHKRQELRFYRSVREKSDKLYWTMPRI